MHIGVIVPAHNEAKLIGTTLETLQSVPDIDEILVVDDGSTDETTAITQSAGIRVITLPQNRGKGNALETGIDHLNADIYLFIDADLGASAQEARRLLAPLQQGQADMAIATLPSSLRTGGFGFVKHMACRSIAKHGTPPQSSPLIPTFVPRAPLSGQRAITRICIEKVRPLAQGYGVEVCLSIDALRAGMRVIEVPTEMRHRETGRNPSGFVHRGRQYLDIRNALRHRYHE